MISYLAVFYEREIPHVLPRRSRIYSLMYFRCLTTFFFRQSANFGPFTSDRHGLQYECLPCLPAAIGEKRERIRHFLQRRQVFPLAMNPYNLWPESQMVKPGIRHDPGVLF